jgi:hypothetical protein
MKLPLEISGSENSVAVSFNLNDSELEFLTRKRVLCRDYPSYCVGVKKTMARLVEERNLPEGTLIGYKPLGRPGYNLEGVCRKTVDFYKILKPLPTDCLELR